MCQIRSGNVCSREALCVAGPYSFCYEPGMCQCQLLDCLGVSGENQEVTTQQNKTIQPNSKIKKGLLSNLTSLASWKCWQRPRWQTGGHIPPAWLNIWSLTPARPSSLCNPALLGLKSLPTLRYKHTACPFWGKLTLYSLPNFSIGSKPRNLHAAGVGD